MDQLGQRSILNSSANPTALAGQCDQLTNEWCRSPDLRGEGEKGDVADDPVLVLVVVAAVVGLQPVSQAQHGITQQSIML